MIHVFYFLTTIFFHQEDPVTKAWEEEFDKLMENLELPESIELFYFTRTG